MSPLEAALDKLLIADLWRFLGLPGEPPERDKLVRSPFRPDRHPSFSIFAGGRRWKDHSSGEQGDAVDFLVLATQQNNTRIFSNAEACVELIRLAGTSDVKDDGYRRPKTYDEIKVRRLYSDVKVGERAKWPKFTALTQREIEKVAELRQLSPQGIGLAAERGLLFSANTDHGPAWVVADGWKLNAQARRYDGRVWSHIGGKKAWTLPGSMGNWPVGVLESADFEKILLVEGAPDLLAAFHLMQRSGILNLGVTAMLGAGNHIPHDALRVFKGKRVRIFAHLDDGGLKAESRWWQQLKEAGAVVDGFDFRGLIRQDGQPVEDLNDFCLISAEDEKEAIDEVVQLK